MAGKDAGLTGTVLKVIRAQNRVLVEGRNLVRFWHCMQIAETFERMQLSERAPHVLCLGLVTFMVGISGSVCKMSRILGQGRM